MLRNWAYHRRRLIFFLLVAATVITVLLLMVRVVQTHGITALEYLLLGLYAVLSGWIALSFWTATLGFFSLLQKSDRFLINAPGTATGNTLDCAFKTAVVMPIHNEDPGRVFAGLRAMYDSLAATGQLAGFEFFVLSDTRGLVLCAEEKKHWHAMCVDFNAHGKVFYRHRQHNTAGKSGNIADFCRRWGACYRYMIVLDADSVMEGATMLEMVRRMEAHPRAGLIQAPSLPVSHESLFARMLQFAGNLYTPMLSAGLNFWQLGEGNYWGHNAILRVQAFTESCGLPELSGRTPFGGHILSHDFVEAALLRRNGWQTWMAYDLRGSYEELPTNLIDYAKRDRRWCQGNLQHLALIFTRGFHGMNRLHLAMGVMSYLASPLWLVLVLAAGTDAYLKAQEETVYFFGDSLFPVWPVVHSLELTILALLTLTMLFLPKLLALLLVFLRPIPYRLGLGRSSRIALSVCLEALGSILLAPILMFSQTKFVILALLRRAVGWPAQRRRDQQIGLLAAVQTYWDQTVFGLFMSVVTVVHVPDFFRWFAPAAAGLILAIPIAMLSSRRDLGVLARRTGLFQIPAEGDPPPVLKRLACHLAASRRKTRESMLPKQSAA